jgi:HD-GYP domain-containing protein (c-di-GMP phosphodiesterase class II)
LSSIGNEISSILEDRTEDEYIRVNLEWLSVDRAYEFDLYFPIRGEYVLLCRKHLKLTASMTTKLNKKKTLFIDKREAGVFQDYMEDNIGMILKDQAKPMKEKSEAVYAVTTNLINDLLQDPKAASINKMKNMVDSQLDYVMHNPGAVNSLMSITEHDYYTYTHSMNVAIYLVGLGGEMELGSQEIQELSMGGMLHDLGKSKISLDIINAKGKLTDEEFQEMMAHPEIGVQLLRDVDTDKKVPENCYFAILHHHEKFCGGGYPQNKKGDEIHLYGRMTKVCDVFDALTTKRSYKEAMTSFEALRLMKEKMLEELDPDIFNTFLGLMAGYSKFQRQA